MKTAKLFLAFASFISVTLSFGAPALGQTIRPDFSGVWDAGDIEPPRVGRGGLAMHPDYEQRGTRDQNRERRQPIPPIADLTDPLLLPWAREELRDIVERRISGEIILEARSQCMPMGLPVLLIDEAGPRIIVQTENKVVIINEELPEIRHIYLDVPHSENIEPDYYGESVGHYEGNTLVVDTIGISTETWVDDFLTPHTESLHVTERYRLVGDDVLEIEYFVEDPYTFTEPWGGIILAERRAPSEDLMEIRCSENNFDIFSGDILPMPIATQVDF
jgi:hypothetical protein